jgi:predicted metal-binding protein
VLKPASSGPALIVCSTCRGPDGATGGGAALLKALLRLGRALETEVAVETMACLWSCGAGASVQLRAPGKIGYVMGGFAAADASDILAFATAYAATEDGDVPFDQWPKGVLGHFIARIPPPGMLIA